MRLNECVQGGNQPRGAVVMPPPTFGACLLSFISVEGCPWKLMIPLLKEDFPWVPETLSGKTRGRECLLVVTRARRGA